MALHALPEAPLEQWRFQATHWQGQAWLEACGLAVSRQMTDKQNSKETPGSSPKGGGVPPPTSPDSWDAGPLGDGGPPGKAGLIPSF